MDATQPRFDVCVGDCTLEIILRRASPGCSFIRAPEWRCMEGNWISFVTKLSCIHSLKHSYSGQIIQPQLRANLPKWIAGTWGRNTCSLLYGTGCLWLFVKQRKLTDMPCLSTLQTCLAFLSQIFLWWLLAGPSAVVPTISLMISVLTPRSITSQWNIPGLWKLISTCLLRHCIIFTL